MSKFNSVVMFSGGLDSTTILLDRLKDGDNPLCVLFDYGQEHKVELDFAIGICRKLKTSYEIVILPKLERNSSGNMVVGNRNIIMLSYAHYIAKRENIKNLYCGFCEVDNSGFPDCRGEFVFSVQQSLDLGYGEGVKIHTPLLGYTKSETYFKNFLRGDLSFVVEDTLTCYHGDTTLHSWGRGCASCMSCVSRMDGYNEFKEYYLDN